MSERIKFPYEIKITYLPDNKLCNDSKFWKMPCVEVGPKKFIFPKLYEYKAENMYNFQSRPEDVWIIGFPRSGNTWTQELVWLLSNNLDFDKALKTPLTERVSFFEFPTIKTEEIIPDKSELLAKMSGPRFIKTGLPLSLLPPNLLQTGCKIIYIARNPKDVAVSYYHFSRYLKIVDYPGDFLTFWNLFKSNQLTCCPYFEHVKEYWNIRNEKNVLFLFYEDRIKDFRGDVAKISNFFGKQLTEDEFKRLETHLSIKNFRENSSINNVAQEERSTPNGEMFIRKGIVGGWKDYFTEEMLKEADDWIDENLKDTDLWYSM